MSEEIRPGVFRANLRVSKNIPEPMVIEMFKSSCHVADPAPFRVMEDGPELLIYTFTWGPNYVWGENYDE